MSYGKEKQFSVFEEFARGISEKLLASDYPDAKSYIVKFTKDGDERCLCFYLMKNRREPYGIFWSEDEARIYAATAGLDCDEKTYTYTLPANTPSFKDRCLVF